MNEFSLLQKINDLTERLNHVEDELKRVVPPKRTRPYKAKRPAKTIN